jgi:hypothetical protein
MSLAFVPITKTHFQFLIALEPAISRMLLQNSNEMMLHRRKVKSAGRMVVPSERKVTAVVSEVRCVFALSYSRSHFATKSRYLAALRRRRRVVHVLGMTVVVPGVN